RELPSTWQPWVQHLTLALPPRRKLIMRSASGAASRLRRGENARTSLATLLEISRHGRPPPLSRPDRRLRFSIGAAGLQRRQCEWPHPVTRLYWRLGPA